MPKLNTICFYCGTHIYRKPRGIKKSKSGKQFCNKKCRGLFMKDNPELFKNNLEKGYGYWKGITLCVSCHKKFHSKYGQVADSIQFLDYVSKEYKIA